MLNLTSSESTFQGKPLSTSGFIAWVKYDHDERPEAIMTTTADDPAVPLGSVAFEEHGALLVSKDVYAAALFLGHPLARRMVAEGTKAHVRTRKGPGTHLQTEAS